MDRLKGKVKALSPVMDGSTHKTWTGAQGTFYTFALELEDGTKGQILGKKSTGPAYSVGDMVEYDNVDGKIKNVKKMDATGKPYMSANEYFDQPLVKKSITINHCMELAVKMCMGKPKPTKGDFLKVTNAYIDWCYKEGDDKDILMHRREALARAMDACELPEEEIVGSKMFFEFAESILEWTRLKLPKE